MRQETEIKGFQPFQARVGEFDHIKIEPSDRSNPSDPSDFSPRDNYLQTPYNEDHYDQGWQDGFKANRSWRRIGVAVVISLLAVAVAIAWNSQILQPR